MISWLVVGGKLKLVVHYTNIPVWIFQVLVVERQVGHPGEESEHRCDFNKHVLILIRRICSASAWPPLFWDTPDNTAMPLLQRPGYQVSTQTVLCSTTGAGDNCCGELMWRRWLGGGCCLSFWRVTNFLWVRIKNCFFPFLSTSSMLGAGAAVSFLVSTPWRYLYSRSKMPKNIWCHHRSQSGCLTKDLLGCIHLLKLSSQDFFVRIFAKQPV